MKNLEKAIADYEKAKEKMEQAKARYEADLKRFRMAEAAKIESENMEIVRIIREMNLSIEELKDFREKMKTCLPGSEAGQKEDRRENDEFGEKEESYREEAY